MVWNFLNGDLFGSWNFDIGICLEFGACDLGFKLHQLRIFVYYT
jgi:hypothetical protein